MSNLPSNWQVKSLGEVANVISGQSPPSSTYNYIQDGLPFFQGKVDFGITFPKVRVWCNAPVKIAKPNDILITVRAPVGPTNICDVESCIGRGLSAIRSTKDSYYKFIFYFLRSIEERISDKGRGSTFSAITQNELREIKIPLPPVSIQKQIADILEQADDTKQKRKEANKLTDEFLQSVFIEMFGDPVKNLRGWKKKTLPQIIDNEKNSLKRGPFGSSLRKDIFIPSGYLVYEQYHALNNDFTFQRYFISEEKYKELKMFKVSEGDLIVSCSGVYLGKIAEVPTGAPKGIINQALLKITLDRKTIATEYFKFLWNTHLIQKILSLVSRGSGIPNFPSMSEVKSIEFPIPPISLQQQFAEIVNKTEALKEKQKQSEQELENLFQSLMQKAFKGEL